MEQVRALSVRGGRDLHGHDTSGCHSSGKRSFTADTAKLMAPSRVIASALAAAALLLAGCSPPTGEAIENHGMRVVRMAVRGSEDDPAQAKRWDAYARLVREATGLPVKFYESADYNGVIQALVSGQVDVATVPGGSYANLHSQVGSLAAPLLAVQEAEGALGYYSAMIVRADSPYRTLKDLKGKSLGYVDLNSSSGYLFPRAKLREIGIEPDTYFGKTSFAGGHTQAVMALENGQFDATIVQVGGGTPSTGFTTGAVYTMARRGVVDVKDFRVIWVAGPIPNTAVVTRTDRPQAFTDAMRGALASIPYEDREMWRDIAQPDGASFAAVSAGHYDIMVRLRDEELQRRRRDAGR